MTATHDFPDNGQVDDPGFDGPDMPEIDLSALYVRARMRRAVALGRALEARAQKNYAVLGYRLEAAHEAGRIERLYRPHA